MLKASYKTKKINMYKQGKDVFNVMCINDVFVFYIDPKEILLWELYLNISEVWYLMTE